MEFIGLIAIMVVTTFSMRALPFALANRITLSPILLEFLGYIPVAALLAIIAPMMLMPEGDINLSLDNINLVVGLIAVGISLTLKKPLAVIILSFVAFGLIKVL